jgi:hypothetical protein
MDRDKLERLIGHHVAFAMTGDKMPDMSGDQRNKLSPLRRRACDDAVREILDHPHIARALALLDRAGDAAAEALMKGEAAMVKRDEHDDLRRIVQNFSDELGRIGAAIGTDEFMPEGAPVPLATQVARMKAALDKARSDRAALKESAP